MVNYNFFHLILFLFKLPTYSILRIGQKNDVNIYYQLFDDTISTRMWNMLNSKKDIISTIMGEKKLTDDEITQLLLDELNAE